MTEKVSIDPTKLKRRGEDIPQEETPLTDARVSQGAIDKILDLAFNPTREKIREVTIIDRVQGRFFPLLDVINAEQQYIMEVAMYRQDPKEYGKLFKKQRPAPPNWIDELLYRTAQWQKSVQGKNLEKATDIALAETETRMQDEDMGAGADNYFKD